MARLNSLIVGLGNAGGGLHLPCLRKLHGPEGRVAAVDPVADPPGTPASRGLSLFRRLEDAYEFSPDDTVVHVCTSPETHPGVIRRVREAGYTRVLSEKPLAVSRAGVEEVRGLIREGRGLEVFVVANWLNSVLTERLRTLIRTRLFGELAALTIEQHKPRFARTLRQGGRETAFDVEIPHQVALALHLAGPGAVTDAGSLPMRVAGREFPHAGEAGMALRHAGGACSVLRSDLCAGRRERLVRAVFTDGHRAEGYFPTDREENFSRLDLFDARGRLISRDTFEDDVLTACFANCYGYFAGDAPRPVSDVEFHAEVTSAIDAAKFLSGATAGAGGGPTAPRDGGRP